ncbi:alanine--tRNA ligase [Mangrovibacterium diazotrophicum]|uniref:Alanine--tRNA ligase n=1 Tax=Mangrovibacterium diazotrophicum TaxID=1261403 RepID=A0A419VX13_9BACT|nr:alanine--tRNA ligase [Mangrovibacterium diazotrophicum]RKD87775.1 alanyl-tRNA synthetase [Mangrovibacterium diazotrophicum]
MNSKAIRKAFLDFFISKQHTIVDSAPMVVKNDPTLMFTNAGMNQFKDIFLGNQPATSVRIADTQKCLRVSGKHNDLEEVGHDTYHHTMFEMLGNWSFGDYFKTEAIDWAWEFLHTQMGIPADRMYATVFEGAKDDNLELDEEAKNLWLKHLPAERVLHGNKKDNFWEMGDTGPCGPCSEIHVDLRDDAERAKVSGAELVNKDNPLVIEIWNLVFIQFNRKADGRLEELPAKHVDTGMGFERLCMVLQGKKSNYDTDVFQTIIAEISALCGIKYGENDKSDIAMRVIADHLRAISFAIADGQLPSNNKAGYVIRRILRRAVRYGYTFLNFREAFIFKLVEVLKNNMGDAFPELKAQQVLIEKVVKEEEESFLRTLSTGIKLLDDIIEKAKAENKTVIEGKDAFTLYDTFGFPLDLTELIARENQMTVDGAGFDEEMEAQKTRSRSAAQQETDDWVELMRIESTQFLGYDKLEATVHIARYRKVTQKKKTYFQLVFDQTPFYGESGGQVGDQGYIEAGAVKIPVFDTQKENNLIVHLVEQLPNDPERAFTAVVNVERRKQIANNHTATHLLHAALREVLGTHVEQKGSLVNADHLRFDFSHFQKVTDEELAQVETIVNKKIRENATLDEKRAVPIDEAKEMGAMMLFGEKYGDQVRVIKFGESVELCGGTHVEATGNIGMLKIVSESAVAAGIRRIEAITAGRAEKYINDQLDLLNQIRETIKGSKDVLASVSGLIQQNSELSKQIEGFQRESLKVVKSNLKSKVLMERGVNIIAGKIEIDNAGLIKDLAFQLKAEIDNLFLVLGAEVDGKPLLTVMISDNVVAEKGLHAGNIIREAAKAMKGGGGGQPFYATAGGKDVAGLQAAIDKACSFLN